MKKIAIIILVIICYSCGAGHLTKRYKSLKIINNNQVIKDSIAVGAFFLEKKKTSTKPKSVFDLSPKGQRALINKISEKEKASNDLIKKLQSTLSSKAKKTSDIIDNTIIEKQIVISISNKSHSPANRISKINVTLDLGNDVKILSCDKIVTSYDTLNLGKLNYSNTNDASLNGNISTSLGTEKLSTSDNGSNTKTKSNGAGLTGTVSASQTFSEEVVLRQRRVALNASINDNKLSLYQDGIVGIDLTGNIIANIVFEIKDVKGVEVYSFSNLVTKATKAKTNTVVAPNDIKVEKKVILLPNLTNDIKATISFDADFRNVSDGHSTISESDDKIELYYGTITNSEKEILITKERLNNVKLWKLAFTSDSDKLPIEIQTVLGRGDLIFNSWSQAKFFSMWLIEKFDDKKTTLEVNNNKYTVVMPNSFSTIKDISILPY